MTTHITFPILQEGCSILITLPMGSIGLVKMVDIDSAYRVKYKAYNLLQKEIGWEIEPWVYEDLLHQLVFHTVKKHKDS